MTKGVQRLSCAYALRRLSSVQTKFSSRQYEKAKLIYREQRKLNPSPLRGKTGRTFFVLCLSCAYALRRLSSVQTKFSSRQYEKAKLIYREQRKLNPSPLRGKTGRTWSKEERLAHSDRLKKRMSDPITKQKCSLAKTGKPGTRHSEETKRKISEAQRNLSEEQRARKSRSKSGSKNPAFGKKWYNNGEKAKQFIPGEEPDGWFIGKRLVQISK
jgi:hypothetical protein